MAQLDWNATIDTIREALPKAQFQNWFRPLKFVRSDARSIVLSVPNRFHEEWLRRNYATQLQQAIKKNCGEDLQLEFEIDVQDENVEAATSELPQHVLEPPVRVQKPILRIIHGNNTQSLNQESSLEVIPDRFEDTATLLPSFQNHFYQLEFNFLATQCGALVAREMKSAYNPLVIQGGVGMGKTHLLSKIGSEAQEHNPELRIRYTNAENFTAEMVQGIRSNNIHHFKQRYREQTDCLLFDDLHCLEKRQRSQEELVYIFNDICSRGGKVVFSSLVQPQHFENFIEPLKSRILAGVIAEIKPPSYEDRLKLLKQKCEQDCIGVSEEVLYTLAQDTQKDVRELLGTLIRLHLQSTLENRPLDQQYVSSQHHIRSVSKPEVVNMMEILAVVETTFGVRRDELFSKSRKSNLSWARQVAMHLARRYTLLPLEAIGKFFGRDHATVMHADGKVKETIATNTTRKYEVEYLLTKLNARLGK